MDEAAESLEEADDAILDASGSYQTLAVRLDAARRQHKSLHDQIRGASDPVFRLVSLMNRYSDTLKDIDKDGKRTTDEQLKLAEVLIDLQGTINEMDPANLTDGLNVIADALGISFDAARALLEEIGLLDGRTFTAFFKFSAATPNPFFDIDQNPLGNPTPADIAQPPSGGQLSSVTGPTIIIHNPVTDNAEADAQSALLLAGVLGQVEGLI